ncbi:hypothetical protein L7F22_020493 [Adiantum nelumboides]|nr:hypothetical protein [Adiantum nelumboides]
MSQATQQVLPTIDEETPFHKGDAMSTQEVVEHESDFVAQKPSNDMNKGSENMLPTLMETKIQEGNTRNSEEKMVVVENQSDVQTSPKPSDDMIIKDTYSMPLRDEEVEGSEKKDEANEEHQALEYPRLSEFCFSIKELHEECGLSIEGKLLKLPKKLLDKDIPDEEWLSVFKCLHKKSTKLFLNHVRDEFVDECRLLYQKVYQATPSDGELLAKSARGFVMKGVQQQRVIRLDIGLHGQGVIQIEASICDGALSSISTMSASSDFYMEFDQLIEELEVLKISPNLDPREADRKEVEVTAITKMLSKAGATTDSGWLKEDLDSVQLHWTVLDFYNFLCPHAQEKQRRELAMRRIQKFTHSLWPKEGLQIFIYGSFTSNFYLPSDDVDILILNSPCHVPLCQRLHDFAYRLNWASIATDVQVLDHAKLFIVKFLELKSCMSFDVSLSSSSKELDAADLIRQTIVEFLAFGPLYMVTKAFLHHKGLNRIFK